MYSVGYNASVQISIKVAVHNIEDLTQGYLRLEKYLNIQDCLEKFLKIKIAFKST